MLQLASVPKDKWEPLTVHLLDRVTLEERDDLAWVECEPALRVAGGVHPLVLLQPRYRHESLWSVGSGVEVYVCTASPSHIAADSLSRKHVRVLAWGLVTEREPPGPRA